MDNTGSTCWIAHNASRRLSVSSKVARPIQVRLRPASAIPIHGTRLQSPCAVIGAPPDSISKQNLEQEGKHKRIWFVGFDPEQLAVIR